MKRLISLLKKLLNNKIITILRSALFFLDLLKLIIIAKALILYKINNN